MEDVLSLRGESPEFQLRADSFAVERYDTELHSFVRYTPEELAGFVDELTDKTKRIYELGRSVSNSFVEIGYLLREIKYKDLVRFVCVKSQIFTDFDDFVLKVFGFQKSTSYNLMSIVREFGDGEGGLSKDYQGYSQTQLVNLLSFPGYERKMFTPEATVAEIKELRAGLKKYPLKDWRSSDFGKKITWRSELDRVRKAAAEEAVAEKKDKKEERKKGILEMLSSAETSESPQPSSAASAAPSAAVVEVVEPPEEGNVRLRPKLEFNNREERKKWVKSVFEGASPYMTLSELDLKIYRYVFVGGARLYRFVGVTYWVPWSTDPGKEDTMSRYYIIDSKYPKFDLLRARSVSQVVDWLTEHREEV